MNPIATITFLGAIQGVFFGLVLLRWPNGNRLALRFLSMFLLFFSLSMLGIVAYSTRFVLQYPHLAQLHIPLDAALGAPFLMYILVLSQNDFRLRRWHWLLFLPLLIYVAWLIPFYLLSAEEKRTILEASYTAIPKAWRLRFAISNFLNFGYIIASFVLIIRHERIIKELYSSTRAKSLLWARDLQVAGAAVFALCVLFSGYDIDLANDLSNLAFSIVIYVFSYRAIRQPDIFKEFSHQPLPVEANPPLQRQPGKYEKSGLSEVKAPTLLEKLDTLMEKERLYLQPDLNLLQLAERLGTPPHQVSQLLNQYRQTNFFDFVNRYRVAHFQQIATDPDNAHLSILALAFDSGFNSKASFNAVFRKITGTTPSAFRAANPN